MNKKRWVSILTIATSLVLCIISTFGITLAFFGGNASANLSTITLKTGIEIGAAIESSVGTAKVVPGQPITITATGTLSATDKGNPTAANAVDGVVRAKFNIGNDLGDVTISGGEDADVWVKSGDYYYLTEDDQTTLREVTVGESVKIYGTLTVSKNFTNADSGKSVEASVIFETIQAGVYDSVTGEQVEMTLANATYASSPLFSAFKAVEYVEVVEPQTYNVSFTFDYTSDSYINYWEYYITMTDDYDFELEISEGVGRKTINAECTNNVIVVMDGHTEWDSYPFIPDPGHDGAVFSFYTEEGGELLFHIGYGNTESKTLQLTGNDSFYVLIDNYL